MINTEREGVSAVQSIVYKDLGWSFREQTVDDFGIDAEIEVADQNRLTGKVIAAQIKSGNSYFISATEEGVIFRFDEKHKKYWLKHVLPVIVLLYHPHSKECIWEVINEFTVKKVSDKRYKIVIPKENQFGAPTKAKLLIMAYSRNIEDLAEDIDYLGVDKGSVFDMLDEKQKKVFSDSRTLFNKKNAASDSEPFEYNREELSNFVATTWTDIKNDIFVGEQFKELILHIEDFIHSTRKTLIILGEAGIGKTTLVKMVMEKYKQNNNILCIQPRYYRYYSDIFDKIRGECEINNRMRVVIIDGWDELFPEGRQNIWYELIDWQNHHKDIKIIITSRYKEDYIWENADSLRIHPLSQVEALAFLKSMTGGDFSREESVKRLVNIFSTPLMLKMLVMVTSQQGIAIEEATKDNLLFSLISKYSEEENRTLESIAFSMMQENKMIIVSEDTRYLEHLKKYSELYIKDEQVSFSHKIFYEIFSAKHIFRHIFSEERKPEEFSAAVWDIFANNLCSIDILNYIKYLIKHENLNNTFLDQLNYNFCYMLERGMLPESPNGLDFYKATSNIFYTIWHIVSYANRIYYGGFKPEISKKGEINLSCLVNVFNKIYFNETYLDFSNTDLSYIKLWRCNLINMNFKNSILNHTNFFGSCMDGSNFQQADLSYSNLVASDLRRVNLEDAILMGANVGNCMISENNLKYFLPYKDTLRHVEKLIIFMDDGTIKYFFDY